MVTPSGTVGKGGKVRRKVLSTGLTKFAVDGSGMGTAAVVCSAAILNQGLKMIAVQFRTQALVPTFSYFVHVAVWFEIRNSRNRFGPNAGYRKSLHNNDVYVKRLG